MLREASSPVSGERLSRELRISRVSIWKQIQTLIKLGYEIRTSTRGYNLLDNDDLLLPWEFPGAEHLVHYHTSTDSTMKRAGEHSVKGCPEGTLIIAGAQTEGRGRLNRIWDSGEGGLYFSLLLRPTVPPSYGFLYVCAASIALIETTASLFNIAARIKWPNDILIEDKKIAGILYEISGCGHRISSLILGIGVNLNNRLPDNLDAARSLSMLTGRRISRRIFLTHFLLRFNRLKQDTINGTTLSLYKRYCSTLSRYVMVIPFNGELKRGHAIDITPHGDLLIKEDDGTISHAFFGECIPSQRKHR